MHRTLIRSVYSFRQDTAQGPWPRSSNLAHKDCAFRVFKFLIEVESNRTECIRFGKAYEGGWDTCCLPGGKATRTVAWHGLPLPKLPQSCTTSAQGAKDFTGIFQLSINIRCCSTNACGHGLTMAISMLLNPARCPFFCFQRFNAL